MGIRLVLHEGRRMEYLYMMSRVVTVSLPQRYNICMLGSRHEAHEAQDRKGKVGLSHQTLSPLTSSHTPNRKKSLVREPLLEFRLILLRVYSMHCKRLISHYPWNTDLSQSYQATYHPMNGCLLHCLCTFLQHGVAGCTNL